MTLTAAQHELRHGRIGSSMIPSIVGLNPWRGEYEAWLEITGRKPREPSNAAQDEGHAYEGVIGMLAAAKLGISVQRNVETTHTLDDFAAATPDFDVFPAGTLPGRGGIAIELATGVLEIKRVGFRVMDHWSGGVPEYVYAQLQWQLNVTGRHDGYIGASIAGMPTEAWAIPRDAEFSAGLLDIAREWHQKHVVRDQPPSIDGSDAARAHLLRLYGKATDEIKDATPLVADLMARQRELREHAKAIDAERDAIENQILEFVGDAKGVRNETGDKITRSVIAGRTSYERVASALADSFDAHERLAELAAEHRGRDYVRVNYPRSWSKEKA